MLNLYNNQIGSQGAKDLAKALEDNKVYFFVSSYLSHLNTFSLFSQKLTTLNLADNQIGDIGAEHIAHALRFNTVKTFTRFHSTIY